MKALVGVSILFLLVLIGGARSYAEEMLGGEPAEFRLAILSEEHVSYYVPSVIILDEKGRLNPLELMVTNHTKKEHGFAIDSLTLSLQVQPPARKRRGFFSRALPLATSSHGILVTVSRVSSGSRFVSVPLPPSSESAKLSPFPSFPAMVSFPFSPNKLSWPLPP